MTDMLVKLYELPPYKVPEGADLRRALAPEKHIVVNWVRRHFSDYWASECEVSFARTPISCFVAVVDGKLAGFACYDATCKAFFGPTGVDEDMRGRGLGKALLLACLHAMWHEGYGYAIIGGIGPAEFYSKAVGATIIENSTPGIYSGMLQDHGV